MITRILDIIYNNSKATPLTSQVDALDNIGKDQLNSIRQDAGSEPPITKKVHFNLPPHHLDKCSKIWRAEPRAVRMSTARRRWENSKYRRRKRNGPLTKAEIRAMVLDGTIPSGISDTGATSTAGRPQDPFILSDQPSNKVFHLPTGGTAQASCKANLHHRLRQPAREVDIVPSLAEHTLISASKFADANYFTIYDDKEVNIYDGETTKIYVTEKAVLQGFRCPTSKLWRIPLTDNVTNVNTDTVLLNSPDGRGSLNPNFHIPSTETITDKLNVLLEQAPNPEEAIHNVYDLPSIEPAIRYLHAAAGFPVKTTWLKAIRNGHYNTWPLLTVKNVNTYFPESEETQQGHMRCQRQGVRSTKVKVKKEEAEESEKQAEPIEKKNDILISVYDTNDTMYTDQTGKFPHVSSRGNRYQMVAIHIDTNSIWVEALKNRTEGELILARRRALLRMKACGIIPAHQVLDNEASAAYKQEIKESGMTYQLVPPNNHRRNIAEKAIQTWKDHFVAVLSGTDNNFPMHLWCRLLPQAEKQLMLLMKTNINPKISAYAYLYGPHNYNAHPFVPIGMEAMVHDPPNKRRTFAQHCSKGYVLGTSTEHYRCWNLWNIKTKATRVSETAFFKHKYITNPTVTPEDAIISAANRMSQALRQYKPNNMCEDDVQALSRLEHIFTKAANNNSTVNIQAIEPPTTPRVQTALTPHQKQIALSQKQQRNQGCKPPNSHP